MSTILSIKDINTEVNHEPRMLDVRLAEALEFNRPRKIRELIKRHSNALSELGEIHDRPTVGRGKEYWLTKKQALYLCTKSETPNATEVTIQMVEVFDQVMSGQTVSVKAHTRRKPQPLPDPYAFASRVPAEDLLYTAQGHLNDALATKDRAKADWHTKVAASCVHGMLNSLLETGLGTIHRKLVSQTERNAS